MNQKTTMGLSIIAGSLAFVGSADAVDLIVNGSFENPTSGWVGHFKTYNYTDVYFAGPAVPVSEGPGNSYSWQHGAAVGAWGNFTTPAADATEALANAVTQSVSLTNALTGAAIDAGSGQYTFSAWLASYTSNPEQPYVNLRFFDATGTNQVGSDVALDRATSNFWVQNADPADSTPPDSSNHMWSKYLTTGSVPASARMATVYLTRSYNAGLSGSPDTYIDLVKLNFINLNDTTLLDSATPADGSLNNSPAAPVQIVLKDLSTAVDPNSIRLTLDSSLVAPSIQKSAGLTTILFNSPVIFGSLSTHTYQIVWSDNGSPVTTKTNRFQFSVGPYADLRLGAPIYAENFDSVAEGSLPPGWTATNLTDLQNPGLDFNDPTSDAYTNWTVITSQTLTNLVGVNADFGGIFNVAPYQVVNGTVLTNLVEGNFALAISDGRTGKQVQYLFTKDYDLTGQQGVYASFHSLYTQNQNTLGAVEYSIDHGSTWLPALYLLDRPDILRDAAGNIDGSNTLGVAHSDVPNLTDGTPGNGNYGQFIGVDSSRWAGLGSYLSARVNDDQVESKRVEVIRLAQADNQPAVRLRFAQMGANGYYFGIDDFGLSSPANIAPPVLRSAPADLFVALGNSGAFTLAPALGIGPFTYQWRHNGVNLTGRTNLILALPTVQLNDAGNYDVVVTNPGGSITSSPPALLTVLNPFVQVTGQWDFNQGDLRATVGRDLEYYDVSVQTNTAFGTTTSFGIADIGGQPAHVVWFTPPSGNAGGSGGANPVTDAWGGYKMFHGASANGSGTNVNQYTLIFDVLYPSTSDRSWRAILQASTTATTGGDDSEYYVNQANGVGISGIYDGNITPDQWHRVALAVNMAGPGLNPVLEKFIDGVKVGEQTGGLDLRDGRFSLNPALALLFSENNGYNNDTYVSSVQFRNGRLSDAALAAMGGPTANKIPGAITAGMQGGNIVIKWSGSILQSADDLAGPWTTVTGATQPYQVPSPLGVLKFYRAL